MLGAHALDKTLIKSIVAFRKIDCLEVSWLYLFRKIWANGPFEQHNDLCWGPIRSIISIVWKFLCCIYSVRYGLMGLSNSIMTYVGGPRAP